MLAVPPINQSMTLQSRLAHWPAWARMIVAMLAVAILATALVGVVDVQEADAVTQTGNTMWFSKWEVALWATAGTAAVVALLVSGFGITTAAAWGMVGTLIGVFWSAVFWGRCAWVTSSPFSAGTYRC